MNRNNQCYCAFDIVRLMTQAIASTDDEKKIIEATTVLALVSAMDDLYAGRPQFDAEKVKKMFPWVQKEAQ